MLLLIDKREYFLSVLSELACILRSEEHYAQSAVVDGLIEALNSYDYALFVKRINSIDMWGGSGAVWEVNIDNETEADQFNEIILEIIHLMRETKILGRGIKPIEKIFKNNIIKGNDKIS